MLTEFAQDLRLARRKSGLSQKEVASLLAIDQSTYSDLERGQMPPTLRQICQLSLIYGRSFRSLFNETVTKVKPELRERLAELPPQAKSGIALLNRTSTLHRLLKRLSIGEGGYGFA